MDDEQIRLFAARATGEETTPEPDPVELDPQQTIEFLAHVDNLGEQVNLAWPDAKVWIAALDLCERIFQDLNIELDDETVYRVLLGRRDAKRYPKP